MKKGGTAGGGAERRSEMKEEVAVREEGRKAVKY